MTPQTGPFPLFKTKSRFFGNSTFLKLFALLCYLVFIYFLFNLYYKNTFPNFHYLFFLFFCFFSWSFSSFGITVFSATCSLESGSFFLTLDASHVLVWNDLVRGINSFRLKLFLFEFKNYVCSHLKAFLLNCSLDEGKVSRDFQVNPVGPPRSFHEQMFFQIWRNLQRN